MTNVEESQSCGDWAKKAMESKMAIDTTAELVPVETRAQIWIICWTEAVSGQRFHTTMLTEPAAVRLAQCATPNMRDVRLYKWTEPALPRSPSAALDTAPPPG